MADEAQTTEAEAKTPKRGIGTVAREAIAADKTNEQALAAVLEEFPEANTTLSSINWYRNKMRQSNEAILSGREAAKRAKAEAGDAPATVEDDEAVDGATSEGDDEV